MKWQIIHFAVGITKKYLKGFGRGGWINIFLILIFEEKGGPP